MALRHFASDELVLSPEQTKEVLSMFWPNQRNAIGTLSITDADRSFAQALLVESVNANRSIGVVEGLFRTFYRPNPSALSAIMAVVAVARRRNWLSDNSINPNTFKLYDAVRVTLARNFRTEIELRIQTGEYVGY
jgi:hypothetical protein